MVAEVKEWLPTVRNPGNLQVRTHLFFYIRYAYNVARKTRNIASCKARVRHVTEVVPLGQNYYPYLDNLPLTT